MTMPDGSPWPRITIVTPSYNQGQYIEETIRSVLLQGYPNLEYIVIDGGSTDDSVETIKRYGPWLTYWVSEPDKGQADALAKGFAKASGSLLGWLNSDDLHLPHTLATVASLHRHAPQALIAGSVINFGLGGERIVQQRNLSLSAFLRLWERSYSWHQPGVFFPRFAYEFAGGIDPSLRYTMDLDLACRLLHLNASVLYVDQPLARFRLHASSKTQAENTSMALEAYATVARYWHWLGCSLPYCACRMLLHLLLRALKYCLLRDLRACWASAYGGLQLFFRIMREQ